MAPPSSNSNEVVSLRAMRPADLPVVTRLYAAAFDEPWPEAAIRELLSGKGSWGLVADLSGEVTAFCLCRTVLDESEILTFAVDPTRRRSGIGRGLLEQLAKTAKETGADKLFLEVGADNPAAQALYFQAGFTEIGRRKDYYLRADRSRVDALLLQKTLSNIDANMSH